MAGNRLVQAAKDTKPSFLRKTKKWKLENVQTRVVSTRLNELSESGATIFGVYQSVHIGGSFEVLSYTEE